MNFQEALLRNFKFRRNRERCSLPIVTILRRKRRRGELVSGITGLADMMRDMECRVGVEIGTYLGGTATIWCRVNPNLELTCIDPYRSYPGRPSQRTQNACYEQACKALEPYNATIRRTASMDAVGDFKNASLDCLFIDGDHRFDMAIMDLVRWAPKVRKGGIIMLHDYTVMQHADVMRAVDSYTHCHRIDPWYATMDYSPTVFWERGIERA